MSTQDSGRRTGKSGKSGKPRPRSAREVAIVVLQRVAHQGAFASAALDAELERARLQPRDAALATEIVDGTQRVLPELDRRIAARLKRAGQRLDPLVQAALRTGCYQIDHLSRVPVHAVVDESVRVVRAARGARLSGFANAVLRALARERPEHPRPPERLIVPEWVQRCLTEGLGEERAQAMLGRRALPPPLGLRAGVGVDRDALARDIRDARPEAQVAPGRVSERALLLRRAGDPRALPGHAQGRFAVQEEGSQAVALALGARPGERVADLCAGHGGKSAVLAERVGAQGSLLSVDLDERKLERIPRELSRLGLQDVPARSLAVDLSVGSGGLPGDFDRVLVDAPCTGLGTIHRRPELLLRLSPDDPERMSALQRLILRHAAALVRPGGVLLYAVCSASRAESAAVVDDFLSQQQEFTPLPITDLAVDADSDGVTRLGPWLGDPELGSPDAYQITRFRRVSGGSE
jgi:16S rRNA (cytosine967-C5)-methyltransferase